MPPPKEDYTLKETRPNIDGGIGSASHKLTLVEQTNFIYVRVIGASNLPVNPVTGTCEPCVELKLGNYKATTRFLQNTTNPSWNQVFAFTKDRLEDPKMEILVRDRAATDDQIIGQIPVAIGDIPTRLPWDSPLAPQWYKLEDKNGVLVPGDLMLAMWVGNQADDAYSQAWHSDAASVRVDCIAFTRPKVYYSPRLWYLRVQVKEAKDLVPSDMNRKPEVYVKARLGNIVLRTKVSLDKSVNPSWNEELIFVAAEPFEEPLVLTLEDKVGQNKEECLGKCLFPLQKVDKRLMPPLPGAKWVDLERPVVVTQQNNVEKLASKLHLTVFLDGVYHVFDEPAYYSSDLKATSPKLKPGEIGILELGILKAEGLLPMKKSQDGHETTDAYCVAKYGSKWARTSTIVGSLSPKWNEQYKWDIYDPCTVITVGVFDNCNLHGGGGGIRDSVIGKVRIRVSTLETNRIYAHSYPLLSLKPKGLKRMGELHLVVRFHCISMLNLLHTYTQPMYPKTQYTSPLSVYQISSLRHQAVFQVKSRLSRADPPLRREVVEYMLDARTQMWSVRKAKANFQRFARCLNGFDVAWKWFDGIRQWKNKLITVAVWVAVLIPIFFPEVVLPFMFFSLSFLGINNYRTRPQHPPHMDPTLSFAETASPDELDEEFDTFPTSREGQILRARYDRLRSMSGMIASTLGDLATQMERVQSLVSWRDPRGTLMFEVFCVVAGVVAYLVPFKWLLAVGVTYIMRPPRLRVALPSIPQNFLRRMPAKEDSML